MLKIICRLIILTVLSSSAFALDMSADGIYSATKEACEAAPEHVLLSATLETDKLRAGYFSSVEFNKIMEAIRQDSVSQGAQMKLGQEGYYASYLLNSADFKMALDSCYPNSEKAKKVFREIIKRRDSGSRFMGALQIMALYETGLGAAGALVGRFSQRVYTFIKTAQSNALKVAPPLLLTGDSLQAKVKSIETNQIIEFDAKKSLADTMQDEFLTAEKFEKTLGYFLGLKKQRLQQLQYELKKEVSESKIQRIQLDIVKIKKQIERDLKKID